MSAAAQSLEQLDIDDGESQSGLRHAHAIFLAQPRETEAIEERHRCCTVRRCFFTGSAQNLPGRDEPSCACRTVVMQRTPKLGHALASDFPPVAPNDDGGGNVARWPRATEDR